jgi:hypothetical protein
LEASDDFDQFHNWDRVHEMHADDFIGSFGRAGEFSDGDGGGVAGDDGFRLQYFVKRGEEGLFDVGVLNDCL